VHQAKRVGTPLNLAPPRSADRMAAVASQPPALASGQLRAIQLAIEASGDLEISPPPLRITTERELAAGPV
jgi:hypothetical protein